MNEQTLDTLMSHKTDDWKTPKKLYDYFIKDLHCIDPCPYKSKINNLSQIYEDSNIYINPPYSMIDLWVNFIRVNLYNNNRIFLLIPARTDTQYFHRLMKLKNQDVHIELYFIKGRLKFNDLKTSAPFPSVLIEMKMYRSCKQEIIKTHFIEYDEIFEYIYEV